MDDVGVDTGEVDRGASELVLEAGLGQAAVAGSAQATALDALGDGALDTSSDLAAELTAQIKLVSLCRIAVLVHRLEADTRAYEAGDDGNQGLDGAAQAVQGPTIGPKARSSTAGVSLRR